jgi:hypothetical protein
MKLILKDDHSNLLYPVSFGFPVSEHAIWVSGLHGQVAFHPLRFRYPNEITKAFHGAGRTGGINLMGLLSQSGLFHCYFYTFIFFQNRQDLFPIALRYL